jgi:hypothetical protein
MADKTECPNCDLEVEFKQTLEEDIVCFGMEFEISKTVTVTVPVYTCPACGFAYTDSEAEEIRDKAVAEVRKKILPLT